MNTTVSNNPQTRTIAWSEVTQRLGYIDLFQQFADGAAERDVQRRLLHDEVAQLKQRRFGAVRLSKENGGQGISLPELFWLARDLAAADPNIAHIFRNHFFVVEQHLHTQDEAFSHKLLQLVADGKTLGVAYNEETSKAAGSTGRPPNTQMIWSDADHGWRVSGTKIYSTGNIYADFLFASAIDTATQQVRQFFIPAHACGITLEDDWDGFGQKLTGSGKTIFQNVLVRETDLLPLPARGSRNSLALLTPSETGNFAAASNGAESGDFFYAGTSYQIYLTTIITGIVDRIFADALEIVRKRKRNFYHGLTELPAHDAQLQSAVGRIAAYRSAVNRLTDAAIHALDKVWQNYDSNEASRYSLEATVAASEAKVVTDEVAANLASLLIDVASGSVVSATAAFDRHWRNIKVIASHNPRLYKERILGDHYLNNKPAPTGAFF